MTSPFLRLPGAVADQEFGVAAHYGGPLAEQRALESGNAIVDLSHHGIVTVSGPDRLSWLNSMTSQQLVGLRPGDSAETLLLDANGRIVHALRVVEDGTRAWLLVDEGSADPLAAYLNRMRFALRVEVADVSAEFAAVEVFAGGSALPAIQALDDAVPESDDANDSEGEGASTRVVAAVWRDTWAAVAPGGVQYAKGDHAATAWSASQVVVRTDALDQVAALTRSSDIRAAGLLALDALEVRAWRPSQRGEVDNRALPHEFDWLRNAVHLTKGCYRGQETVAKVHNLGHPPRRLVLLHLEGSGGELPQPGALVFRAGHGSGAVVEDAPPSASRPVGRVTRVVLHHEWGGIALALVKRAVAEDAMLEVRLEAPADASGNETGSGAGSAESTSLHAVIAAGQEVIVPADAGAAKEIPRLQRL